MTYFYILLVVALQVYLAVHAYNTGRESWIFIIIFVPLVGSLIYLFVAWIPDIDRQVQRRSSRNSQPKTWSRPNGRPTYLAPNNRISATTTKQSDDATQKLKLLKELLDEGLITEADYETKKAQILSQM